MAERSEQVFRETGVDQAATTTTFELALEGIAAKRR